MLDPPRSAELREQLLSQLEALLASEGLLAWAKASLPLKNTLLESDARLVESAYQNKLEDVARSPASGVEPTPEISLELLPGTGAATNAAPQPLEGVGLAYPKEPPRKRSKAHLLFVREQPCLVCQQSTYNCSNQRRIKVRGG